MLSKNQIKDITALSAKKQRDESGLFVAEGTKLVSDLLTTFNLKICFATKEWLSENSNLKPDKTQEITQDELKKISSQKTPQGILAVFEKKENSLPIIAENELCIALDDIQDPGNLGTIIRVADWFGIRKIVCSPLSADVYGQKTVQSTMGAIARVSVYYTNLSNFIQSLPAHYPVYGTFMKGKNIYTEKLSPNGLIVMGNEGNGISKLIADAVQHRLNIPNFPQNEATSESLNVAVATSIVCAEFRRRLIE